MPDTKTKKSGVPFINMMDQHRSGMVDLASNSKPIKRWAWTVWWCFADALVGLYAKIENYLPEFLRVKPLPQSPQAFVELADLVRIIKFPDDPAPITRAPQDPHNHLN